MRARGARSSKGEQAQANANANASATEPMLEVGPAGTWFQVGKGRRVDLARAPALGSLLAVLAEQRIDKPGEPLTADAIAERASQSAARDLRTSIARVYVNVAKLRRRGLEGILVQQSGGYLLHPAVSCVVRDDE